MHEIKSGKNYMMTFNIVYSDVPEKKNDLIFLE